MYKKQILSLVLIIISSLYAITDWQQVSNTLNWNIDSRIYFYSNSFKGPYTFGFVCNSTLIQLSYYSAFKICNLQSATYIVQNIFDVIPRHQIKINDPNIAVARATSGDFAFYLLVNGQKWKFSGGANSTYNYGIDSSKIIYANYTYLDNFPTTYHLY